MVKRQDTSLKCISDIDI